MQTAEFEQLIPVFFVPAVLLFFVGVGHIVGFLGGWHSLAKQYPSSGRPLGDPVRCLYAGFVLGANYNGGVATLLLNEEGIFFTCFGGKWLGHPPAFVRWQDIDISNRRWLLVSYHTISIDRVLRGFQVNPAVVVKIKEFRKNCAVKNSR